MRKLLLITSVFLALFSCSKDELGPQCLNCKENEVVTAINTDVLIINEGNFGSGSGSISLYKSLPKTVTNDVFNTTNGFTIGNVAQSAYQIDNKGYITINNSSKIEIIDINTFASIGTIDGFNSPRYFLPINNSKAYVTDLYSNSIQIVNLSTNSISGSIAANGWTEELIIHKDTVYVCDMTNDNLLIIDPVTNSLIDSVKIGESPNSLVVDQNNKIWIMCSGGFGSTSPQLIKFNPLTRSIESTFTFPNISDSPGNLKINAAKNQLYFINQNIIKMSIDASALNSSPFITNNGNIFYGLDINPINEDVYISDAIDYNQNGVIFRYSSEGTLLDQFTAGVIPGHFLFVN